MSDEEIKALLELPKILRTKDAGKLILIPCNDSAFVRFNVELQAESDYQFTLCGRLACDDVSDFSAILTVSDRKTGFKENLLRCNGAHEHRNKIEKTLVTTTHVHWLTQRYLDQNRFPSEGYAEATDAYSTFDGALEYLMKLAHIHKEGDAGQMPLFSEKGGDADAFSTS